MSKFEYKVYLYRCEWQVLIEAVNQYGQKFRPSEILYCKSFATKWEAKEHLESITIPSEHTYEICLRPRAIDAFHKCILTE
jgi:hypothetical protein